MLGGPKWIIFTSEHDFIKVSKIYQRTRLRSAESSSKLLYLRLRGNQWSFCQGVEEKWALSCSSNQSDIGSTMDDDIFNISARVWANERVRSAVNSILNKISILNNDHIENNKRLWFFGKNNKRLNNL
jgi:hypothetical protein